MAWICACSSNVVIRNDKYLVGVFTFFDWQEVLEKNEVEKQTPPFVSGVWRYQRLFRHCRYLSPVFTGDQCLS